MLCLSFPAIHRLHRYGIWFLAGVWGYVLGVVFLSFFLDSLPPQHWLPMVMEDLLALLFVPLAIPGFAMGLLGLIMMLPIGPPKDDRL